MANRHIQKQSIKALQKLAMTAQMRHSVQILSMSVSDLNDYIDTVLASNPLLEKEEPKYKKNIIDLRLHRKNTGLSEPLEDIDIEQEVTPQRSLLEQIRVFGLNEDDLEIAEYIVFEINADGFLDVSAEEIAEDLTCDVEDAERVTGIIQAMDPPGIGARDVRECLQLQLERAGQKGSVAYKIVTGFLSELAVNDLLTISRSLNIGKDEVSKAAGLIRTLNPRPGSTIFGEKTIDVIPDLVATIKNNRILLEINRGYVPSLKVYDPYRNEMDMVKDPEAKEFLQKNTRAANNLLDNIKRREETLCRVAYHILDVQKHHIEHEKDHMKVLTLKDLAEALDLHVSTVSRAISNKYIELNEKVMPVKELLSHGFRTEATDNITSKSYIKGLIREIVENEDKKNPFSDQAISEKLQSHGIDIKRRTVVKYRDFLRILPSHLRRVRV